jgi:PAS domain-containing protein
MQTLVYVLLAALLLAGGAVIAGLHRRVKALTAGSERAQELLAKNTERLNLALDGADEALWDWDVTKNRTYYSERWSQMLGYSPGEIGESDRAKK